jgi:hypothetical protein
MRLITGDIFDPKTYLSKIGTKNFAIAITTNGFIKNTGESVMGRGVAAQACRLFPNLPACVGLATRETKNRPAFLFYWLRENISIGVFTFPVKPDKVVVNSNNIVSWNRDKFSEGDTAPGWAAKADLSIIVRSWKCLQYLIAACPRFRKFEAVIIPKPGCGAGELEWEEVESALDSTKILHRKFYIIDRE